MTVTRRGAAALFGTLATGAAAARPLDGYAWSRRVLLLFAAGDGDQLRQQRALLAPEREGLASRDMAVLAVIGPDRVEHLFGPDRGGDGAALRTHYAVPAAQPFVAILIGKDGGEKWRSEQPARPGELFALIDTMPMRQREATARR